MIQRTPDMIVIEDSMRRLAAALWNVPVEQVKFQYLEEVCGVALDATGLPHSWSWDGFPSLVLPWSVILGSAQMAFHREVARILDRLVRQVSVLTKALASL